MVTTIELAPQQRDAVAAITDWYQGEQQTFRLFGYAGTGKTTLARHIVDTLGAGRVLYAAYTGKAAYVLRGKGCHEASTVHSLIYQPVEKARAELDKLKGQAAELEDRLATTPARSDVAAGIMIELAELRARIKREQAKVDSPDWILRDETELETADLLVLDEVSMVGERMALDLLSYGCKVLCLGDPAQLPPVDGGGYFINAPADQLLTEIHRSALDSPVTRLATAARNSQQGDQWYGIYGRDGDSGRIDQLAIADLLAFDQVLVGRNATRWQAVHLLRALRGLGGTMPQPGDRIITLANSSTAQVFNGQQFDVLSSAPHPERDDRYRLVVRDEDGVERDLPVWAAGFRDFEGEQKAKRDGRGNVAAATFAQAITVHKSQGSQYQRVLVIDESSVFHSAVYRQAVRVLGPTAAAEAAHLNGCRWLYTAITRASEQVVIAPRLNGLVTA